MTTYTISKELSDSIAVTVDPITFTIGLMCFLGYFFLILYGGIGLVALPLDLVCSFGTRPVFVKFRLYIRKVLLRQLKRSKD